jgi:hypothetical protein
MTPEEAQIVNKKFATLIREVDKHRGKKGFYFLEHTISALRAEHRAFNREFKKHEV